MTNHSSKTSSYLLEVDFLVDGERVASRSTGIDEVDPGETTRVEAVASGIDDDDVRCKVAGVDRFKS